MGALVAGGLFQSCIENDVPYPHIQPNFTSFVVEHQTRNAAIDSTNRTVTVFLDDEADIYHVDVVSYSITPGAVLQDSVLLSRASINLSSPYEMTMSIYQDYIWTIQAEQPIDYVFTVENQIGATQFDMDAHTITVTVPESYSLNAVKVLDVNLGVKSTLYTPALKGATADFSSPLKLTATQFGRPTEWTVTVLQSKVNILINNVDAWGEVAWAYVAAEEGKTITAEYRVAGEELWEEIPSAWISTSGSVSTVCIPHLEPLTAYEVRASNGEEQTISYSFTTGLTPELPDASFQGWSMDGKMWCPWAADATPYWGCGNKGSMTLGKNITTPIEDSASPTGYNGAFLNSQFIGIASLGKFGAGNIFTGSYVRTDGANGVLSFGREFTARPTRLTGTWKFTTAPIAYTNTEFSYMMGQPDTCIVWMALCDWTGPMEIRTKPSDRQLFNPDDESVIAYGYVESGRNIANYTAFDVVLNYKDTRRVPTYIVVVASASKYGDYFTGGNGSMLWLKDFTLQYDYIAPPFQ